MKPEVLTKTQGRGIRYCCLRDDCDKCFRKEQARAAHMTQHTRVYTLSEIKHGTTGGYRMELKRGIPTCILCRRAWADKARLNLKKVNRRTKKRRTVDESTGLIYDGGKWVPVE